MLPPSLKTERAKLDDFYAARSEAIPPLPWQTFPPPFSRIGRTKRFRIVAERFRNPRDTHHTKTSIIAGLVNIEAGFMPF